MGFSLLSGWCLICLTLCPYHLKYKLLHIYRCACLFKGYTALKDCKMCFSWIQLGRAERRVKTFYYLALFTILRFFIQYLMLCLSLLLSNQWLLRCAIWSFLFKRYLWIDWSCAFVIGSVTKNHKGIKLTASFFLVKLFCGFICFILYSSQKKMGKREE